MAERLRLWFGLPWPVFVLGAVSLLTDTATEAIYPLLPFFLTQLLGAGAVSLGFIEGAAEAASSVLKVVSGRLSDRWNRRKPIVVTGYTLSSFARPFISLATSWPIVFGLRLVDRIGKGIRGAPRDAMLAELVDPASRGRVYGFHRAMDHAGAVLGPLLATAFLLLYPGQYRALFALTSIPGAAAVLLLRWVPERHVVDAASVPTRHTGSQERPVEVVAPPGPAAPRLPAPLIRYLFVLLVFTLGNSTDAFLLLRLTDIAGGPTLIPLLWALIHIVKSGTSLFGGAWSDRLGRRGLIAGGWIVYALVYIGFALTDSLTGLIAWFMFYGIYFGLVEGAERALVADFATPAQRGLAFGVYNAVAGIGALVASVLFGLIWEVFGVAAAFGTGAALALLATALLFLVVPVRERVPAAAVVS